MKVIVRIMRLIAQITGGVICLGLILFFAEQLRITNDPIYVLGLVAAVLFVPACID